MNEARSAACHAQAVDRLGNLNFQLAVQPELGSLEAGEGRIDLEEALTKADSRDGLALKIRLSEGGDAALPESYDAAAF